MINYTWTDEDIKLAEKFIEIRKRGFYCDSTQLTEVYNRVLNKRVAPTNCGSCLRQRCAELEDALNHFKASESKKEVEVDNTPQEKNKAAVEAGNEDMKARMARVRAARGKKK